jgi:hypothetical protein
LVRRSEKGMLSIAKAGRNGDVDLVRAVAFHTFRFAAKS